MENLAGFAPSYRYSAIVRRVIDGDTISVDIDCGLHAWVHGERLRLRRINAPEMRGETAEAGRSARGFLCSLLNVDQEVIVQTFKDRREKYGRYLAEIWVWNGGDWFNVNDAMLQAGHAKSYME